MRVWLKHKICSEVILILVLSCPSAYPTWLENQCRGCLKFLKDLMMIKTWSLF